MRRRLALLAALIVAAAALSGARALAQRGAPAAQQAPLPTFRAGADIVAVDVSVRQGSRPVIGLTAADFELVDNGTPQQVASITYETLPIDVTVALDVSASVTGPVLDQLRRSVQQLRGDLRPRDRLKLVTFNRRIRRLVDFDASAADLDAAVARIEGTGSSAVFDSLAVALTTAVSPARRHLVVLFSDGVDSGSVTDPETLFGLARRSTATIAVVLASTRPDAPVSVFSGPAAGTIARLYDRMAKETGGAVVAVSAGDNLSAAFRHVLNNFRASYVLYFTPTGVERGGFHALGVRVKRRDLDVRARSGYIAP